MRGRHASGGQPTVVCLYMDAEWAQHLAAGSAALGARQFFVSSSSDHQPHINPSESAAGCTSSLLSFTTTTPAAFLHSRSLLVIMSFRKIAVAAALVAGLQMAGSSAQS